MWQILAWLKCQQNHSITTAPCPPFQLDHTYFIESLFAFSKCFQGTISFVIYNDSHRLHTTIHNKCICKTLNYTLLNNDWKYVFPPNNRHVQKLMSWTLAMLQIMPPQPEFNENKRLRGKRTDLLPGPIWFHSDRLQQLFKSILRLLKMKKKLSFIRIERNLHSQNSSRTWSSRL
jgi:hypothetical protein